MPETRKQLAEACAPLFLFLSTFWRNAAASKTSLQELKQALQAQFDALGAECARDPRLAALYERARYGLVAASDQVVLSSSWPQRAQWATAPLEKDQFKKLEGGKRFFKLVEEVLQDPSEEAVELAECLFTCMALGFRGELLGERKELERCRRQLFEKARLAGALGEQLTPEAYGRNAEGRAPTLPTANVLRLAAVAVGALVFMLLTWYFAVRVKDRKVIDRSASDVEAIAGNPF